MDLLMQKLITEVLAGERGEWLSGDLLRDILDSFIIYRQGKPYAIAIDCLVGLCTRNDSLIMHLKKGSVDIQTIIFRHSIDSIELVEKPEPKEAKDQGQSQSQNQKKKE